MGRIFLNTVKSYGFIQFSRPRFVLMMLEVQLKLRRRMFLPKYESTNVTMCETYYRPIVTYGVETWNI